jgi:hypothetical protein
VIRRNQSCAALLGLFALAGFASEPLPRIFFDATERNLIVAQRAGAPNSGSSAAAVAESSNAQTPASRQLRLDAIAVAATGTQFAWINGQRHTHGSRLGAWQLEVTRQGVILRGAGGRSRLLRVGETLTVAGREP